MRKKAKPGKGGRGAAPKMLTKIEPVPSFFNFFSPPQVQPQYLPDVFLCQGLALDVTANTLSLQTTDVVALYLDPTIHSLLRKHRLYFKKF
jgi:hypothetical protein